MFVLVTVFHPSSTIHTRMAEFNFSSAKPVFNPLTGQPVSKYNKDLLLETAIINHNNTNHINKNRTKVKQFEKPAPEKEKMTDLYSLYPGFGKVPNYILKEHKLDAQTSIGDLQKEEINPNCEEQENSHSDKRGKNNNHEKKDVKDFFTREEKRKIVVLLEEYYKKMYQKYLSVSLVTDTFSKKRRKVELENIMDEITCCIARMKTDDVVFKSEFPSTENSLLSLIDL